VSTKLFVKAVVVVPHILLDLINFKDEGSGGISRVHVDKSNSEVSVLPLASFLYHSNLDSHMLGAVVVKIIHSFLSKARQALLFLDVLASCV